MITLPGETGLTVLTQGPSWFVLDKPAGLPCHRSRMVRERDTVASRLKAALDRPIHLVHRLDRPTSGCLIVALDGPTCTVLQEALHDATKQYLALVRGFFKWDDPVVVQTPMKDPNGTLKEARTTLSVLGRSHDPRCSLLRAEPATGRYHQVRRHCRDLDHPVIGDRKHGDNSQNKLWGARGMTRLALHCHRLRLPGHDLDATAPLPADMRTVLEALPWWDQVAL